MFKYFSGCNKQRASELVWKHWYNRHHRHHRHHRHLSNSLFKAKKQILDNCVEKTKAIKINNSDCHSANACLLESKLNK